MFLGCCRLLLKVKHSFKNFNIVIMEKIALLSYEKICIMKVMILLWSAFSSKYSVSAHPEPKLAFSMDSAINTSGVYSKPLT